jgi:hypothetical protein
MANIKELEGRKAWEDAEIALASLVTLSNKDLLNEDLMLCAWANSGSKTFNFSFFGDEEDLFGKQGVPFKIEAISFKDGDVKFIVRGKETKRKTNKWSRELTKIVHIPLDSILFEWLPE